MRGRASRWISTSLKLLASNLMDIKMSAPELFRPQAVEHKKNNLFGEVLVLPKLSHSLLIGAFICWFVAVMLWLANSSYARKETVSGWLEPPSGVVRVYAEDAGIIKKILIAEGEHVIVDQPLIIVNGDRILATGDHLETQLLREYESQQSLLNEQLIRTKNIYEKRDMNIKERISASQKELALLDEQLKIFDKRYQLARKQAERYRSLIEAGHVSTVDYDNVVSQELDLHSELQILSRNKVAQINLIEQLQNEQRLLPDEGLNDVSEVREKLSSIAQQIAQLSGQQSHIIKAPRTGVVNNLQAVEGQQASTNNIPLLTILPSDGQLTAHLLIPVRAVGFIEANQKLDIRYDAFPYQKFGLYSGEILSISKTLLLPNELLNTPIVIREPVYRVTAELEQRFVHAYGKDFSLKPGMTLSADVRLGERTLAQWLFEPIYSLQGRL